MTQLINCAASDRLGYPAYWRAVYDRPWGIVLDSEVLTAIQRLADSVNADDTLVAPIQSIDAAGGESSWVFDFRTASSDQANHTVGELVKQLELWSLYHISSPMLGTLTRVTSSDVYGGGTGGQTSRQTALAARDAAKATAAGGAIVQVENLLSSLKWLVLLIVIVAALYFAWPLLVAARRAEKRIAT